MTTVADRPALRVGLIGAGWVACDRHLPALARHPAVDLVVVADRNAARAAEAARRFGAPASVATLDEVLDRSLDVLFVCTPPWTHAEIAIAALDRGVHVFTEKPMAMCTADAEAMCEAAERNRRLLCVSHNFVSSRSVRKADAWLGGAPARYVLGLQASSPDRRLPSWIDDWPAGLFRDESPHLLYCLQHFLGPLTLDHVRSIPSSTGRDHPAALEVLVRGPQGTGQMTMLFEAPVSEWHVGIMAERQVIDLDLFRDIAVRARHDGAHKARDIARSSASVIGGHVVGFASSGARMLARRQSWGHDVLIGEFIGAVRGGRAAPVALADSVAVVRLTDAILAEVLGPRAAQTPASAGSGSAGSGAPAARP